MKKINFAVFLGLSSILGSAFSLKAETPYTCKVQSNSDDVNYYSSLRFKLNAYHYVDYRDCTQEISFTSNWPTDSAGRYNLVLGSTLVIQTPSTDAQDPQGNNLVITKGYAKEVVIDATQYQKSESFPRCAVTVIGGVVKLDHLTIRTLKTSYAICLENGARLSPDSSVTIVATEDEDRDADGVSDWACTPLSCVIDNCPAVKNPDQADFDGDGLGDACSFPKPPANVKAEMVPVDPTNPQPKVKITFDDLSKFEDRYLVSRADRCDGDFKPMTGLTLPSDAAPNSLRQGAQAVVIIDETVTPGNYCYEITPEGRFRSLDPNLKLGVRSNLVTVVEVPIPPVPPPVPPTPPPPQPPVPTAPACGNGTQEEGEACDQGLENSDKISDRCRQNCVLPKCGDQVIDGNEQCDAGPQGSEMCNADCTYKVVAGPGPIYTVPDPDGIPISRPSDRLPDPNGAVIPSASPTPSQTTASSGGCALQEPVSGSWMTIGLLSLALAILVMKRGIKKL